MDLPIAGIILALRPLVGGLIAERAAVAIAPMLPLLLLLFSLALTCAGCRPTRLPAWHSSHSFSPIRRIGMFMPTRIDHHGWQLALLALTIAGIADPATRRGGAIAGIASAMSLWIGLEMLIYLAIAGAAMALFWVADAR